MCFCVYFCGIFVCINLRAFLCVLGGGGRFRGHFMAVLCAF